MRINKGHLLGDWKLYSDTGEREDPWRYRGSGINSIGLLRVQSPSDVKSKANESRWRPKILERGISKEDKGVPAHH